MNEVDGSTTNELQTISRTGLNVTLSNGGTYQDSVLSEINVDVMVSNNGYLTSEVDGSTTNELQTISKSGSTVTLSNGGGSFLDSVNVYIAGAGIDISNNVISTTCSSVSPWYLGKDTLGGIVFYIYKGADGQEHGLVVSKTSTSAQWQSSTSWTHGNRTWDGDYNTSVLVDSPAKDWISSNFSSDWYLPSLDELSILWHNRLHVNKALHAGSHTLMSTTTYYWSSTEYTGTLAWCFFFSEGSSLNYCIIESIVRERQNLIFYQRRSISHTQSSVRHPHNHTICCVILYHFRYFRNSFHLKVLSIYIHRTDHCKNQNESHIFQVYNYKDCCFKRDSVEYSLNLAMISGLLNPDGILPIDLIGMRIPTLLPEPSALLLL